ALRGGGLRVRDPLGCDRLGVRNSIRGDRPRVGHPLLCALPSGHRGASVTNLRGVGGGSGAGPGTADSAQSEENRAANLPSMLAPTICSFLLQQENATTSRIRRVLCPRCHTSTRVLESRRSPDGAAVRRRRECAGCRYRFTTFERRELDPAYVIKRG